jgi:dTMP kinase
MMLGVLPRGILITFEGGEGAGKSTLIEEVARQLASDGYHIVKTREPGGTHLGEHIRSLLLDHSSNHPLSAYAELCLFLAARAQHIEEIIAPALEARKIVLCDRYNDSTIAYQGGARGLGMDKVAQFCDFVCHGVQPNLTLYLDIDPGLGLSRARRDQPQIAGARGYDRIESEGLVFHQKIREAFLAIHAKDSRRFVRLDASQPPAMLSTEAIRLIRSLIK